MESTIRCPRCDQEVAANDDACPACGHIHGEHPACERHTNVRAAGVCVICGSPVCDECNTGEQVHYSCPTHATVPVIEGWAQIYTTSDTVEADLIRDNLQSEGIDAAVLSQKDRIFAFDLGDFSPVRVLVPAYEYLDAAEMLAGHMDPAGEVLFACPTCGEAFEQSERTCRACGNDLPTGGVRFAELDTDRGERGERGGREGRASDPEPPAG